MLGSNRHRLVIDTNIFVSGILFGGKPAQLLHRVSSQEVTLVITPQIKVEILRKLEAFEVSSLILDQWSNLLDDCLRVVTTIKIDLCRDPKDNIFLEACLQAKADFLITGDKDLLDMGKFKNTKIIKVAQYLEYK